MNDRLLRELGELARKEAEAEQARLDERWDRLAAGTLTAEEETELKALAASSPEAREAYEDFRPLGADFQARMASAINAQREREAQSTQQKKRKPVPPFWWVVRRMEVWIPIAAAAVVFFLVRWPWPGSPLQPGYGPPEITIRSEFRGSEPGRATPGSQVDLIVRPQTAFDGHGLVARGYLAHAGSEELHPWQLESKINEMGVVQLHGTVGKEFQPGIWTLWIVIGRKDKLPTARDLQSELSAGRTHDADWQAVSRNLPIEASASP